MSSQGAFNGRSRECKLWLFELFQAALRALHYYEHEVHRCINSSSRELIRDTFFLHRLKNYFNAIVKSITNVSTWLSWKEIFINSVINLLEHIFISILHIKGGMKCYIISIALIAQLVEQQVPTLKVKGSSLAGRQNNMCKKSISTCHILDEKIGPV